MHPSGHESIHLVEPFDFDYDYDFFFPSMARDVTFWCFKFTSQLPDTNQATVFQFGTRLWSGTFQPDWSGIRKNNVKPFSSRSPSKVFVFPTLESCIAAS